MAGDLGAIENPVRHGNGVPILDLVSERDEHDGYASTRRGDREVLTAPTWSVTLVGAPHAPPFVDPGSPHSEGVVALTMSFLDAMRKCRPERADHIPALAEAGPELYRTDE